MTAAFLAGLTGVAELALLAAVAALHLARRLSRREAVRARLARAWRWAIWCARAGAVAVLVLAAVRDGAYR